MYHESVLLAESVEGLKVVEGGVYVDVTYGGGGHSKEILKRLHSGVLVAFDQDSDAHQNEVKDERLVLVKQNFKYLKNNLKMYKYLPVNGILADLGVSSHQFDVPERGFSFRFDAPLDMRMNANSVLTAVEVLATYEYAKLAEVFGFYGESKYASKLAGEVVNNREVTPLKTTYDLKKLIEGAVPERFQKKEFAKIFQALRIEVNQEMEVLKDLLKQSVEVLKKGGRLVVISYHSLEDRLVKNFIKAGNFEGELTKDFFGNVEKPLRAVGKMILPSEEEIERNPRARSAKLRIAEKL